MPTLATTRLGEMRLLDLALPGKPPETCGVVLHDPESGVVTLRLRRDWEELTNDPNDLDVLEALADDLTAKVKELGAETLLAYMANSLSNTIRISDPESVLLGRGTLNRLYERHVAPTVLQYSTHLPLYNVRAAAGSYGERQSTQLESWIEVPEGFPVRQGLFVARVVGQSMEPEIPSGSLCIFREYGREFGAGSRNGKLVLVEDQSEPEQGERYTVKRYRSVKEAREDGWTHSEIWMEPLNPAFEPWQLTEDKPARVVGEFIAVLE